MKYYVVIYKKEDYEQYKNYFDGINEVDIVCGDIFNYPADCIVAAGNSYGFMDGGIDRKINYRLNYISELVQQVIYKEHFGELPVGQSIVVPTVGNQQYRYLCYTPMMKVPDNVSDTYNAYLAFRGMLVTTLKDSQINSCVVPMFCTGVGGMSIKKCLHQYMQAYLSLFDGKQTWKKAMDRHNVLIGFEE